MTLLDLPSTAAGWEKRREGGEREGGREYSSDGLREEKRTREGRKVSVRWVHDRI